VTEFDYDIAIVGGAFSGAATALIIKRKHPAARVLIIEKAAEFDRKVGESTTEVSSAYMTRILGWPITSGITKLAKQGLRMWFSNRADQRSMTAWRWARVISRGSRRSRWIARRSIRTCSRRLSQRAATSGGRPR
jgi:flavin-dependent dehydrogenase